MTHIQKFNLSIQQSNKSHLTPSIHNITLQYVHDIIEGEVVVVIVLEVRFTTTYAISAYYH